MSGKHEAICLGSVFAGSIALRSRTHAGSRVVDWFPKLKGELGIRPRTDSASAGGLALSFACCEVQSRGPSDTGPAWGDSAVSQGVCEARKGKHCEWEAKEATPMQELYHHFHPVMTVSSLVVTTKNIFACMLSFQSCLTLYDPVNCSPPGSSIHGILQAKLLEWVAIPFTKGIFLTQGSNPSLSHCRQIVHPLSH